MDLTNTLANNTYGLTNMLDDFDLTLPWLYMTLTNKCIPIHKQTKSSNGSAMQ